MFKTLHFKHQPMNLQLRQMSTMHPACPAHSGNYYFINSVCSEHLCPAISVVKVKQLRSSVWLAHMLQQEASIASLVPKEPTVQTVDCQYTFFVLMGPILTWRTGATVNHVMQASSVQVLE